MLRIKGKTPPLPPVKEELPIEPGIEPGAEPTPEPMPEGEPYPDKEPSAEPDVTKNVDEKGGGLDPVVAGYKGPEQGPFMCGNCKYFLAPGSCEFVSGEIDEMGVCNIFSPAPGHDGQDVGAEEEAEVPTKETSIEPPVEEPVPDEPPVA